MEKRTHVTLNSPDSVLIAVDPDNNGYTKLIIEKMRLGIIENSVQWSPINITEQTALLPYEASVFDYDIYVRCACANSIDTVKLAITRIWYDWL